MNNLKGDENLQNKSNKLSLMLKKIKNKEN